MIGTHASINGQLVPIEQATIPVDDIAFGYGFGVYENVRLKKGTPLFLDEHIDRLLHSAELIKLEHTFNESDITSWAQALIKKNTIETANIKMLLIGHQPKPALYLFLLAPKFVERKEYRDGVETITVLHERFIPQAKSLNMLGSVIAYNKAKAADCFDALLINRDGHIIEGTRSNFFAVKNKTLITPPKKIVLAGITRRHMIECAAQLGWTIEEYTIALEDIFSYDGAFLTNSSAKIVPIRQINGQMFDQIAPQIQDLRALFDTYLKPSTSQA